MTQHAIQERGNVAVDVIGKTSTQLRETFLVRTLPRQIIAGVSTVAICCILSMGWSSQAGAADCASLISSVEEALKKRDIAAAEAVEQQIAVDAVCSKDSVRVQRRRATVEVTMAEELKNDPSRLAEREKLLLDADKPGVQWLAAYALGEMHLSQRKFVTAAEDFERAIEIVKDESFTPRAPGKDEMKTLLSRSGEAKMLAANEENNKTAAYVTAPKTRDGKVGGTLSAAVRGVTPTSVPLPINFVTNGTEFTEIGRKAAQELGQALIEQRPQEIVLVGHTDERGEDGYNMRLSKARVEAVVAYLSSYLAQHHVAMDVRAEWQGKRQPIQLEDTNGLTQEDIWALNRRVEWKRQ
jgi:outer membrane protein OmpA-like peptidoglycan-associated protein